MLPDPDVTKRGVGLPTVPDAPAVIPDGGAADWSLLQHEWAVATQFPPGHINHLHLKELRALIRESASRKIEALRLYEPLAEQDKFHASRARIRLARGSNRGGKTLPAAAEVARAVCGADPFKRYPLSDGRCFCVGKDLSHVGQVMWRKLGRAGAFRIIRDEVTGVWRAYRPWMVYDAAYKEKTKPAPPLIPPRLIVSISWESKKDSIPKIVKLQNGWELSFFSSLGKPPQGVDLDIVWMDEEVVDSDWLPEMTARLLDRSGRMLWSATPQAGTDQLFELHEQAEKAVADGDPNPTVEEFEILLANNPHISEENKRAFAETLNADEYEVRIGGEFAINQYKVYPEFSVKVHCCPAEVEGRTWEEATRDWTRYMVVDPGHQVCACLFAAVPPSERHVFLEDELYIKQCHAMMFAEKVAEKTAGKTFQAFIMDAHMAIHSELGIGKTVQQQYAAALAAKKVFSLATRNNFILASDNVMGGVSAVKDWLRIREDGSTKLMVLEGRCPNFVWEIKRYHNRKVNGQISDKPDNRKHNHAVDCLRYLALYNPKYKRPPKAAKQLSGAVIAFRKQQERDRKQNGYGMIRLGPGRELWRP